MEAACRGVQACAILMALQIQQTIWQLLAMLTITMSNTSLKAQKQLQRLYLDSQAKFSSKLFKLHCLALLYKLNEALKQALRKRTSLSTQSRVYLGQMF